MHNVHFALRRSSDPVEANDCSWKLRRPNSTLRVCVTHLTILWLIWASHPYAVWVCVDCGGRGTFDRTEKSINFIASTSEFVLLPDGQTPPLSIISNSSSSLSLSSCPSISLQFPLFHHFCISASLHLLSVFCLFLSHPLLHNMRRSFLCWLPLFITPF